MPGRFKLLVMLAAVALFAGGAALLALNLHGTFRQAIVERAHQQLQLLAITGARRIEGFLAERDRALHVATTFPLSPIHRDGECGIETFFDVQSEQVLAVALVGAEGQILHSHPEKMTDLDRQGLRGAAVRPQISQGSSYGIWYGPARARLAIAHPVPDSGGLSLAFVLDATSVFEKYVDIRSPDLETCGWLINESTTLLGSHDDGAVGHKIMDFKAAEFPGADLSSLDRLVHRAQRGELGVGVYTCPRHGQRLLAYAPVAVGPLRWTVGIAMGHGEIAGMINRHALATAGLAAFVVLVFTVLGFLFLRAATKREKLAREAEFLRESARTAEALTESEERYRTVVESANDAILLAHDGVCLFANQGALRLLGAESPEQLVGRPVTDFVHPSDRERVARIHEEVETTRDAPRSYECRAIAAGALRFDASVTPIPFHQKPCVLVSWRDATARTLAEEHARNQQRLRSLGYLAAGIAHDFNNALTTVYGNLSLALAASRQNIDDNLRAALAGTLRSKELASRLLSFAEGDEIDQTAIAVEVPLRAAIARAIDRPNIRCDVRVKGTPAPIRGDLDRLVLAFETVLKNAQEAMPDGGVISISVDHVEVTAEAPNDLEAGSYVRVSVVDRGMGIGPDELPLVFDPYFSTKGKGDTPGVGLGLSIARSIINKHGGRISLESTLGVGTTCSIDLPAESTVERTPEPPPIARATQSERAARILVMDDDEALRAAMAAMLRALGHSVVATADGEEAIAVYREAMKTDQPFQVVILDLTVLDGLGGAEAIKSLVELDPQVRALVASGYSSDPVLVRFREYGFVGALRKPFGMDELREALAAVLSDTVS